MPPASDAGGGRPPKPGAAGAAALGAALNMSSPEEDAISDHRFNRAKQAGRKKGKGITVFLLNKVEELRGQVISKLAEGVLKL